MRLLIAGGGTGGHIYPGLTIAEAVKNRYPQAEILFVGTEYGLEKDIIPRASYRLETISVRYFPRKLSPAVITTAAVAARGMVQAFLLLRRFQPDVVVGTGGYVAGPVLLAAALRRIPTLIQEQNALPGITNRILGRIVRRIALGYPEAARFFPRDGRVIVTGNPIRPEIMQISRREGLQRLNLDPNKQTLVVFGGSQGGRSINEAMRAVAPRLNQERNLQVIHQTGKSGYEKIVQEITGHKGEKGKNRFSRKENSSVFRPADSLPPFIEDGHIRIIPYIYDMPAALAAADLVVGRAGAISIAEITARGLPAVLIPFPYAAGNHQEKNARVLERAGAARVILDRELNGEKLGDVVLGLLREPARLHQMAAASRKLGKPRAVEEILGCIESLARRK